ncbi:MAG: 2,3,4,5-tetrahydropyridine-2,6-dicarboxylate N-succinyltransferase, partial [Actinomycetota bacterium]|nr:2,3,4,5-tetrahydropyridine-2,6-dicarboxylate N-succinyltransferase [Actinomycetota bacterium]
MTTNGAFATGIATVTNGGSADPGVVLDVWFPEPELD